MLSKKQAQGCLRDLFTALAHIHSLGIIHRDVKPSNILLRSPSGPAYLADFGIAWSAEDPSSEPANSKITDVGTTCYRPPELLFGNRKYGCSLDLWAAGCTVAEVVEPSHQTLFDSGELGSELALIQSIFKKLGTPNLSVWPVSLPLYILTFPFAYGYLLRKLLNSMTGARWNFMNILQSPGRPCLPNYRRLNATWSAA